MSNRLAGVAAALAILPVCAGCGADTPTNPEAVLHEAPALAAMPGDPGAAAGRQFYKVNLRPLGDSLATGVALIDVVGGQLRVRIHATGVEPLEHIPQHIHLNPSCDPGGAVMVNLDAGLTVTGESQPVGAAFPVANRGGVMNYEATRSLESLRAAFNSFGGTALADTGELLEYLDLENRNVHMHVAFGPPFPAVNCGEVKRIN